VRTASRVNRGLLVVAVLVTFITGPLAWFMWFRDRASAVSVFLLGLSLGPCLAVYAAVPRKRKRAARLFVLAAGGLSILALSLLGSVELDLEGFFMLLFAGTIGAAVFHTLITVIAGPMLFGRLLCGWGCWRAMVLEFLPVGRGQGRRKGIWRLLPLAGLAASVAAATVSVFVLGHQAGGTPVRLHGASVASVAAIAATYYVASIGMALALKDRRAFCKYLCPSGAIMRLTARKSLARMAAKPGGCDDCGACTRVCPMDIDVGAIVGSGAHVPGGECILCQRCAHACPTGALHLEFTIQAR
jgi:polyferredoxin